MRVPFNGNYGVTQGFNDACCRASYAKFGMSGHNGIDYGLPCGTPVVAPISGTISYFNDPGGYGNAVFIRGEGVEVVLGHLSSVSRKSGNVSEGEQIGNSGTTGNSTGCHLHFGVRNYPSYDRNNGFYGYSNPQDYLNKGGNVPTLATREVVNAIYATVLGRNASDDDAKSWVGVPVDRVILEIANSKERGDFARDRVKSFYKGFLGRKDKDITQAEVESWVNQPERTQISGILDSNEAVNLRTRAEALTKALEENAELKKKLANSGGVDQGTKAQISETNSIVKKIWEGFKKIFNIKED